MLSFVKQIVFESIPCSEKDLSLEVYILYGYLIELTSCNKQVIVKGSL